MAEQTNPIPVGLQDIDTTLRLETTCNTVSIWNFATWYKLRKKVLLKLKAQTKFRVTDGNQNCSLLITVSSITVSDSEFFQAFNMRNTFFLTIYQVVNFRTESFEKWNRIANIAIGHIERADARCMFGGNR